MKEHPRGDLVLVRAIATAVIVLSTAAHSQDAKFTALFILNFAKYIDWPAGALSGDYELTVLGDDPVFDELKTLASGTKVGTSNVSVKKVASIDQVGKAHLLYISPDNSSALPAAIDKVGKVGTLLVTNKKGLAKEGAGINLVNVGGKQRFEINAESLKKGGLVPKPVLFKLGTVIGSAENPNEAS